MKGLLALLLVFLSWSGSGQAIAQGAASPLVEGRYGNIAYVSGGIGDEELNEIRSRERHFNLKLLFAERSGSYLGDVNVVLTDIEGKTLLDVKSVGPFLLVQLPGGSYEIKASMNGQVQQGRLSVTAKGRRDAVFRW